MSREILIPEIVNKDIIKEKQNINIKLKKVNNNNYYSKKSYNNIDNSTTTTTTNTIKNDGLIISFIKFIFNAFTFPFKVILKIYYYIENKLPKDKRHKHSKFYNKWLKKQKTIYSSKDEIY